MDINESRYERLHDAAFGWIELAGFDPADAGAVHLQPAGLQNGGRSHYPACPDADHATSSWNRGRHGCSLVTHSCEQVAIVAAGCADADSSGAQSGGFVVIKASRIVHLRAAIRPGAAILTE
jgi:hypothetical protein